MLLLAFPDYCHQSQRLAAELNIPFESVEVHRFPDGESLIRLPTALPEHVILCRSLNRPNDKLIELLLFAKTARELGAKRITLVAPYLCYMRQDKQFQTIIHGDFRSRVLSCQNQQLLTEKSVFEQQVFSRTGQANDRACTKHS